MNIPSSLVTKMRALNEDVMPDTAIIFTRSLAADGYGGETPTFTEAGTVACRLTFVGNKPQYQDAIRGAQIQPNEAYLISLPYGTSLRETDRISIGTRVYTVVSQLDSRSYQMGVKALVQRVSGADYSVAETTSYPGAIDDFTD